VAQARQDLATRDPGEAEVEHHQLEGFGAQRCVGRHAIANPVDGVGALAQMLGDRVTEQRVIFGDEDSQAA
jgi:hypothetical protein